MAAGNELPRSPAVPVLGVCYHDLLSPKVAARLREADHEPLRIEAVDLAGACEGLPEEQALEMAALLLSAAVARAEVDALLVPAGAALGTRVIVYLPNHGQEALESLRTSSLGESLVYLPIEGPMQLNHHCRLALGASGCRGIRSPSRLLRARLRISLRPPVGGTGLFCA